MQAALSSAAPDAAGQGLASGAIVPVGERLTLTVEEAATLPGIGRAFAYPRTRIVCFRLVGVASRWR